MTKVKTATGKEFECDYFNPCPQVGQLNLRVLSTPLAHVAAIFSDKSETAALTYENQYAAMYTKLVAIVPEMDAIRVVLGKE